MNRVEDLVFDSDRVPTGESRKMTADDSPRDRVSVMLGWAHDMRDVDLDVYGPVAFPDHYPDSPDRYFVRLNGSLFDIGSADHAPKMVALLSQAVKHGRTSPDMRPSKED